MFEYKTTTEYKRKIKEYKLLVSDNPTILSNNVTFYLQEGWMLYGEIKMQRMQKWSTPLASPVKIMGEVIMYSQSIIKEM